MEKYNLMIVAIVAFVALGSLVILASSNSYDPSTGGAIRPLQKIVPLADEQLIKPVVETPACADTDGGLNFNQKGTISDHPDFPDIVRTDYCQEYMPGQIRLVEYFCGTNQFGNPYEFHACNSDEVCTDGACVFDNSTNNNETNTTVTPTCAESDGGLKLYTYGHVWGNYNDASSYDIYDSCASEFIIDETWCLDDGSTTPVVRSYDCRNYANNACRDGVCVTVSPNETNATISCSESDGGLHLYDYGHVWGNYEDGTPFDIPDTCLDQYTLAESWCQDGIVLPPEVINYDCRDYGFEGCEGGICVRELTNGTNETNESLPDLAVLDMYVGYNMTNGTNDTLVHIVVKNIGDLSTGTSYWLQLSTNETNLTGGNTRQILVPMLASGQQTVVSSVAFNFPSSGWYFYTSFVDYTGRIVESNENNNMYSENLLMP